MKPKQLLMFLVLVTILLSLVFCEYLYYKQNNTKTKKLNLDQYIVINKETMTYGTPKKITKQTNEYAYAISYPETNNKLIDEQINSIIKNKEQEIEEYTKISKEQEIMTINYEIYEKDNYLSLVLINKYLKKNDLSINTYIFEKESGMLITNIIEKEKIEEVKIY